MLAWSAAASLLLLITTALYFRQLEKQLQNFVKMTSPEIGEFLSRYSGVSGDLHGIAAAFANLPYENVTKILKQARSNSSKASLRQPQEVLSDHLRWNTGGTCFSLCNTLRSILIACGYECFIAMGDMHYGQNIHCAVIVKDKLSQRAHLLDPGYLLHYPISLPEPGDERSASTTMNTVTVKNEGGNVYSLYTE